MVEDKLLIWKFKRGDNDALRRIYEKYKNDLLKLAVVLTGAPATAEDVVHDVFVKFAQSPGKIRSAGSLKGYLSTCVVNRIRNLQRERKRHKNRSDSELDRVSSDSDRPEQWAILSEQLGLLSKAMGQLPQEQREVIALYMQGDMAFRQIAKVQSVSVSMVQGRFRYGLDKLRKILNSEVTK